MEVFFRSRDDKNAAAAAAEIFGWKVQLALFLTDTLL